MGLFDSLAKQAFSGLLGGQQPSTMLETLLREAGGLTGLRDRFSAAGLQDVFSTWIGSGENAPIQPSQLEGVLGSDALQQLASRVGLSAQMILPLMSQFLPQVIDRLTPSGTIEGAQPTADQLQSIFSEVMKGGLSSFFGRNT